MSFVTTQPEALSTAAIELQSLGTSLTAQNAAAAAPTTAIVPAAADPVSALQAAQFDAYGNWYQQVSAQAAAFHQMLVNTLGANAGSYSNTEAANQAATGSTSLTNALGGAAVPAAPSGSGGSPDAIIGTPLEWVQNTGAAASDFIALGQGQFLPGAVSWQPPADVATAASTPAVSPPPVMTGAAGPQVLAGAGQASQLSGMSVPPGWAAPATPSVGASPPLDGASPVATTPAARLGAVPAGLPSMASAGRSGAGWGAPRYGLRPTVMPTPVV